MECRGIVRSKMDWIRCREKGTRLKKMRIQILKHPESINKIKKICSSRRRLKSSTSLSRKSRKPLDGSPRSREYCKKRQLRAAFFCALLLIESSRIQPTALIHVY